VRGVVNSEVKAEPASGSSRERPGEHGLAGQPRGPDPHRLNSGVGRGQDAEATIARASTCERTAKLLYGCRDVRRCLAPPAIPTPTMKALGPSRPPSPPGGGTSISGVFVQAGTDSRRADGVQQNGRALGARPFR